MNVSTTTTKPRHPQKYIVLAVILTLCALVKIEAQETPFSFDGGGKYMSINADLARRLGIFPEYPNLLDARMFRLPDSTLVLEITQLVNDVPQRRRVPMDETKLIDIRNRFVTAFRKMLLDVQLPLTDLEKVSTVIGNTAFGLGYGLFSLGNSTTNRSPVFNAMIPLVLGGGSLWAVNQPWFNRSSATFLENGLTIGVLHGFAIYSLFGNQDASTQGFWATGIATGIAESVGGIYMADKLQLNYGQTSVMTNLGNSGLITGIGLGFLFSGQTTGYSALALAGSGLGFYTGYVLSQGQPWGNGDGLIFGTLSPLGLIAPLATTLLVASVPDLKLLVATSLLTHLGSYALGNLLIKDKDFTFSQGTTIAGATTLGMLASLSVFIFSPSGEALRYLPSLALLGGALGFSISYSQLAQQAELQAQFNSSTSSSQSHSSFPEPSWLDNLADNTTVQFSPLGLVAASAPALAPVGLSLPIVSFRHTFQTPNNKR